MYSVMLTSDLQNIYQLLFFSICFNGRWL